MSITVLIGIFAFFLFYLYDLNTVYFKTGFLNLFFVFGALLLAVSTAGILHHAWGKVHPFYGTYLFGFLSILMLFLLIYTLFFALPASEAYAGVNLSGKSPVCNTGMYALCRHPGVIWLIGFYLFLYLALPTREMLVGAISFSVLDVIYIILQDMLIFPKQFDDYQSYKEHTPFLIPTGNSIREAKQSFRKDL